MKTLIVIRTQFEAIHHWPACPIDSVDFLRHPHRHLFHVEMAWEVSHADRDIEFIDQKRKVERFIKRNWQGQNIGSLSCEMLATMLLRKFNAGMVGVFEDGENGAEVYAD